MERAISVEEKIRRAEEIYERRRQGITKPVTKVSVNKKDKKDLKLLKKMIIQLFICTCIYLTIYTIKNSEYVFSNDFISTINEVLSYDTNFMELYEICRDKIMSWIDNNEKDDENSEKEETIEEDGIGGSDSIIEEIVQNIEFQEEINIQDLSQEEQDILNIKNTTSFIRPIEAGNISSRYGRRDTATGNVPKDHTGTDIAASTGTKIFASTDGEVVLASEEGDYRKTYKDTNR